MESVESSASPARGKHRWRSVMRSRRASVHPRRGPRRRRPRKLHGDKGYDYPHPRRWLAFRGIRHRLARKGIESSRHLGRPRWVVDPAADACTAATSASRNTSSPSPPRRDPHMSPQTGQVT
ncbi:hypothetical protein GCM10009680_48340 [Streptomyces yatensis]|uniref:Transposase n=1 Tax=Streptomyces yatensis TaxID=155177 RepID=A0ABN2IAY8_9ACTN